MTADIIIMAILLAIVLLICVDKKNAVKPEREKENGYWFSKQVLKQATGDMFLTTDNFAQIMRTRFGIHVCERCGVMFQMKKMCVQDTNPVQTRTTVLCSRCETLKNRRTKPRTKR